MNMFIIIILLIIGVPSLLIIVSLIARRFKQKDKKQVKKDTLHEVEVGRWKQVKDWWNGNWHILLGLIVAITFGSWVFWRTHWHKWNDLWNYEGTHSFYYVLCFVFIVGIMMSVRATLKPVIWSGRILILIVIAGVLMAVGEVNTDVKTHTSSAKAFYEGDLECKANEWSQQITIATNIVVDGLPVCGFKRLLNESREESIGTGEVAPHMPNGTWSVRYKFPVDITIKIKRVPLKKAS